MSLRLKGSEGRIRKRGDWLLLFLLWFMSLATLLEAALAQDAAGNGVKLPAAGGRFEVSGVMAMRKKRDPGAWEGCGFRFAGGASCPENPTADPLLPRRRHSRGFFITGHRP